MSPHRDASPQKRERTLEDSLDDEPYAYLARRFEQAVKGAVHRMRSAKESGLGRKLQKPVHDGARRMGR